MHEAAAIPSWVLLAYLISGVCFILALRGLSSPASSRQGNYIGIFGMAIAIVTTLVTHVPTKWADVGYDGFDAGTVFDTVTLGQILAAVGLGGVIGLVTARRIQ